MTDLVVLFHPGLHSDDLASQERRWASDPDCAPQMRHRVAFTEVLPAHLDRAGFLRSILTGSQDGPAFPAQKHLTLPEILAHFNYACSAGADDPFRAGRDLEACGLPGPLPGARAALEAMLARRDRKQALLLFSSGLEPAELFAAVNRAGRAATTCIALFGAPRALDKAASPDFHKRHRLRFPALFLFPERLEARREEAPIGAMELLPTLLEILGLPPHVRKGLPAIAGESHYESLASGRAVSERLQCLWTPVAPRRVVQKGMHKLIIDEQGLRLYRLDKDPEEGRNVLDSERDTWRVLADALLAQEDRLAKGP